MYRALVASLFGFGLSWRSVRAELLATGQSFSDLPVRLFVQRPNHHFILHSTEQDTNIHTHTQIQRHTHTERETYRLLNIRILGFLCDVTSKLRIQPAKYPIYIFKWFSHTALSPVNIQQYVDDSSILCFRLACDIVLDPDRNIILCFTPIQLNPLKKYKHMYLLC